MICLHMSRQIFVFCFHFHFFSKIASKVPPFTSTTSGLTSRRADTFVALSKTKVSLVSLLASQVSSLLFPRLRFRINKMGRRRLRTVPTLRTSHNATFDLNHFTKIILNIFLSTEKYFFCTIFFHLVSQRFTRFARLQKT